MENTDADALTLRKNLKFEIDENRLLFSLSLEGDDTGSRIEEKALGEGFKRQNERHVTILGGATKKLLKNELAKLPEDERAKKLSEIKTLLESLSWDFSPGEIYKVQKEGVFGDSNIIEQRQSYICMLDMPDMEIFYAQLNALTGAHLPVQVPHITLFTKGEGENPDYQGFPISSMEDFNTMHPEHE